MRLFSRRSRGAENFALCRSPSTRSGRNRLPGRLSSVQIDFEKRVAVVTGGAKGIGRATAVAFAEAGAEVAVWDQDEERGSALASEIGGCFCRVDVADRESVDAATATTIARFGRVDVLINNAGIVRDAQFVKVRDGRVTGRMSGEDFDDVLAVNVKGVFLCTQAIVHHMIEQRYGRIVSASSVVGLDGNFGQTNYVAAKSGVIGMTKVWARELGKHGITANAVAPGFIETDMARGVPNKILTRMLERTPVGRLGAADEVARAYLFLASEEAGFINGATLRVDGGLVIGT